jgi:acetoin utilization deacetylase AcuC-like enzyme
VKELPASKSFPRPAGDDRLAAVSTSLEDYLPKFLRRSARRLRHRLGLAPFEVVYHEKYNAAFPDVPNDPLRAERILAFLAAEGLVLRRSVHRPAPVWLKALERVHGASYLDSIHDPRTLTSIMGSEIGEDLVDRLIDLQRLQTGGTLTAVRRAREHGVAVNLAGGLHHAHAEVGGGFCIINDVAVAIAAERRRGFGGRVLVVDLDLHDGDGTRRIFAADPEVYTFSIHARHWGPTEAESSRSVELGSAVTDGAYLEAVERHLPEVFAAFRPRLVIYLAGCDPAHDDYLGDWRISSEAMLERDLRVFALARSDGRRIPLVVLLAGGYGPEAWRYTARFLSAVGRGGRPLEPPSTAAVTFERYRHLARLFDPAELSGAGTGDEFGLTEDDLLLPGWGPTKETRFLGFYTRHGIELVLERSGFLDRLRDLGFAHPALDFQLDDPGGQTLRIFGDPSHRELLTELKVLRDRRTVPGCELLSVEWLLMQNPRTRFGPGRPRLPGQEHPGLGMLYDVVAMLTAACERLHLDGLVFVPSEFHVAAYAKNHLAFFDPATRASFEALLELFGDTPLPEATVAVAAGRVVDADTGETFRWRPEPMILPLTDKLKRKMEEAAGEARKVRFRLLES